jgi:hypothetical protein
MQQLKTGGRTANLRFQNEFSLFLHGAAGAMRGSIFVSHFNQVCAGSITPSVAWGDIWGEIAEGRRGIRFWPLGIPLGRDVRASNRPARINAFLTLTDVTKW